VSVLVRCAAGTYSASSSSAGCILCPVGRYSASEASTQCTACDDGVACPPGSISAAGIGRALSGAAVLAGDKGPVTVPVNASSSPETFVRVSDPLDAIKEREAARLSSANLRIGAIGGGVALLVIIGYAAVGPNWEKFDLLFGLVHLVRVWEHVQNRRSSFGGFLTVLSLIGCALVAASTIYEAVHNVTRISGLNAEPVQYSVQRDAQPIVITAVFEGMTAASDACYGEISLEGIRRAGGANTPAGPNGSYVAAVSRVPGMYSCAATLVCADCAEFDRNSAVVVRLPDPRARGMHACSRAALSILPSVW
jgi:hypothetical protein